MKLTNPKDWQSIPKSKIIKYGGGRLLEIYNGSVGRALAGVFPGFSRIFIKAH